MSGSCLVELLSVFSAVYQAAAGSGTYLLFLDHCQDVERVFLETGEGMDEL